MAVGGLVVLTFDIASHALLQQLVLEVRGKAAISLYPLHHACPSVLGNNLTIKKIIAP